jgi:hypothetical protein
MSDTPRTDEAYDKSWEGAEFDTSVLYDLARELERELARAKTLAEENGKLAHKTACELAELRAMLTKTQGEVTISRNGYVEELEQQRDEAVSDLEFRRDLYKIQTKRLDDVCEQRDRLANACRLLMKIIGPLENPVWATDEEIDRAYDAGEAALEAITKASND